MKQAEIMDIYDFVWDFDRFLGQIREKYYASILRWEIFILSPYHFCITPRAEVRSVAGKKETLEGLRLEDVKIDCWVSIRRRKREKAKALMDLGNRTYFFTKIFLRGTARSEP